MLNDAKVEQLTEKVYKLLEDVGILVEHDEVLEYCLTKGCTQGPDHRIRIPRQLIDEIVAFQKKTEEQYERDHDLIKTCGPDWTNHLTWGGQQEAFREQYKKQLLMQAFDCGPTTYYDYPTGQSKPVNTEIFDDMMKLAETIPEVGYTSMWYRQDRSPMIERLDSLRRSMDLTAKFAGIEAIYPEVVKYLKEVSEILTDDPKSSAYLAGSECMTMPLILEERSAEDIVARKAASVHRYHVASMPTLGVSTPVTLAGSIVMGAAELLGGMAICWCVDPESDITARMITLIADMRNGNATTFGPYMAQYNNAVRQLFIEKWGGHCMVEVHFTVTARKPGLQAVFENWYGTSCRQRWDNDPSIPYAGMGTMFNGGLGSPTQFMLDLEIRRAQWLYKDEIPVDEESLNFEEVVKVCQEKGNFLMSDHTIRHCRDLWVSPLIRSDQPTADWEGNEKSILDQCDEMWRARLATWEPPAWPEDKKKAIDGVLSRAKKEFGID